MKRTQISIVRTAIATVVVLVTVAACSSDSDSADSPDGSAPSVEETSPEASVADTTIGGDEPVAGTFDVDAVLAADLDNCAPAPTGEGLKIGYAADLSDLGGFADGPASAAAEHFVNLVNCVGGVDGTSLELIVQNIEGDPEVTARAAQDLLDAGVSTILGPPFADFGQPLLQVTQGDVPVQFVGSTEPTLSDVAALSYLTAFDDTAQATAAAEFALDQGWTTASTFSSPGPYFGYVPEVFTEVFEAGGGTVISDYNFVPLDDVDFSTQVNEIAALDEAPDVIYSAMLAFQAAPLASQLESAGVASAILLTDVFEATGGYVTEGTDGMFATTHSFPEAGNRVEALAASFEAATGEPAREPVVRRPGCRCDPGHHRRFPADRVHGWQGARCSHRGRRRVRRDGTVDLWRYGHADQAGVHHRDGRRSTDAGCHPRLRRPHMSLLAVERMSCRYGSIVAVRDVDLTVGAGELVGLIGPNGAGKTTTLNAIAGLIAPASGTVTFDGGAITGRAPDQLLRDGIALVPEHRRIFVDLTVAENLKVGGVTASRPEREQRLERMTEQFPVLASKWTTPAGYLSGGEAQQLAIARALMSAPKLLLMDEPTLGLAPRLVDMIFELIADLRDAGTTMLVVEQNATRLLEIADRAYVVRSGGIALSGAASDLLARDDLFESFVRSSA